MRSGERTRSAIRPPTAAPMAIPPKKPVRIAETAWVVLPKTRTSWRDQTISYDQRRPRPRGRRSRGSRRRAVRAAPDRGRGGHRLLYAQ